ncbi:hypothetical protein H4219_000543 [Mycoemilia scoparia]|uniref:Rab5-interacting protein n=1 Tax=Mycoemilia scoparia TaxID=417184 RepID=A0A9W8A2F9_9FUNG|nr:hypothetical protein H4219_000543 [Mycoemilia scoparia]
MPRPKQTTHKPHAGVSASASPSPSTGAASTTTEKPSQQTTKSTIPLWQKALQKDQEWDKNELRTVFYWILIIGSLALGTVYGILGFKGIGSIITYFVVSVFGVSIYMTNYLGHDGEEYGGKMEIFGESFGPASAIFMVSWVSFYTWVHG